MPQTKSAIHATPFSIGGVVFIGIVAVLGVVMWSAWMDPEPSRIIQIGVTLLWLAVVAYMVDGLSEHLSLERTEVVFVSLLQRPRRIELQDASKVEIVHEGLNQERGIVSVIFRGPTQEIRIPLGAFWSQKDLERFLVEVSQRSRASSQVKAVERPVILAS